MSDAIDRSNAVHIAKEVLMFNVAEFIGEGNE